MFKKVAILAGIGVLLWLPTYVEGFFLSTGLSCMAAAIAAIGLTVLTGITGQLSLAHAFFVAVGAYGYSYLTADAPDAALSATQPTGLGWPPIVAMLGAVLLAGLAGALFSPIAGRLRGIYLGLASIGLVFIGQHIMQNARDITGGFNGRQAEPFSLFGFSFSNSDPDNFSVLGVPYGQLERLWYLGLLLVLVAWWFARNLVHSRPGRAMATVRDSETAAAVMGVNVPVYKAAAFTVSSMYAGLAGVFVALVNGVVVPEYFNFFLSIDFLVMIVIGGLGSIGGAVAGAVLVTALPLLFTQYAESLPLVDAPGGDGLQSGDAARFLYGAAVVAVLIFARGGLAGLARRFNSARTTQSKESTA